MNWNRLDDTAACLESLTASDWANLTTIVVDNGSEEGIEEPLKPRFGEVVFIRNPENLGFAGGMNTGIRRALELDADYVLLLNNDVAVDSAMVSELVRAAQEQAEVGIVGPLALLREAPDVVASAGLRCDLRRAYQGGPLAKGERDRGQFQGVARVDVPAGAAMLVPSEVIREVGMLDESLFLYIEDVDWAFRMRAFGKRCYTAFGARLWHRGAASSGGEDAPQAAYYFTRNVLVVSARHEPLRRIRNVLRQVEILGMVLATGLRAPGRFRRVMAAFAGWRDYLRGRLGPAPRAF